ncbi:MAG: RsmE family RNA methyltransferase [Phycisphaerae bacterium]
MREIRLFCESVDPGRRELSEDEANHARKALRLQEGADVTLFNGRGDTVHATIAEVSRKAVTVAITDEPEMVSPSACAGLALAVAFPKSSRQSFMIEKVTELGVGRVIPMITDRSVVIPQGRVVDRCRRWALEAAKQSHRAWLPVFDEPRSFRDIIEDKSASLPQGAMRFIADLGAHRGMFQYRDLILNERNRVNTDGARSDAIKSDVLLLIGPEGGWSEDEREAAAAAGVQTMGLGPHTLRTETAAIAAVAQFAAMLHGD